MASDNTLKIDLLLKIIPWPSQYCLRPELIPVR